MKRMKLEGHGVDDLKLFDGERAMMHLFSFFMLLLGNFLVRKSLLLFTCNMKKQQQQQQGSCYVTPNQVWE